MKLSCNQPYKFDENILKFLIPIRGTIQNGKKSFDFKHFFRLFSAEVFLSKLVYCMKCSLSEIFSFSPSSDLCMYVCMYVQLENIASMKSILSCRRVRGQDPCNLCKMQWMQLQLTGSLMQQVCICRRCRSRMPHILHSIWTTDALLGYSFYRRAISIIDRSKFHDRGSDSH